MSICTNYGAPVAPNNRFRTECGRPVAARRLLMSNPAKQITFCVHHAARGLVEIGSTSVPLIQ